MHLSEMALRDPMALRLEKFVRSVYNQPAAILSIARAEVGRYKAEASLKEKGSSLGLRPGDVVRVRSREEIESTLDDEGKLGGCLFMNEMWKYCGTKQNVLKRVEYFYDEGRSEMRKMKNTVLLDGLHCHGSLVWKQTCDKHCLFFWKEDWLEKVE